MLAKSELHKIYTQKKQKTETRKNKKGIISTRIIPGFVNVTFEQFEIWFNKSSFEKGCFYCSTTNQKSEEIYYLQRSGKRFDATRGGKRGRRLELDRINPSLPYDNLDNIVWCCYWCNNSKSNFFTAAEFKLIATEIGKVLKAI